MRDMGSPHKRMQELCDCYAETDPLKEMALLSRDRTRKSRPQMAGPGGSAWCRPKREKDISGKELRMEAVRVVAEYRDTELPAPDKEIGRKIIDAARQITHIEGTKGEIPLAIGIRDSSIEIRVKVKEEDGAEKITLKFGKDE